MTLCIKTKAHCSCQPDIGAFCPDYKPDCYVQCLMDAITELLRERSLYVPSEVERLKEALRQCKAFVVGEKIPNWADDSMTYVTRGKIADVCDLALAHPHHPRDISSCSSKEGT